MISLTKTPLYWILIGWWAYPIFFLSYRLLGFWRCKECRSWHWVNHEKISPKHSEEWGIFCSSMCKEDYYHPSRKEIDVPKESRSSYIRDNSTGSYARTRTAGLIAGPSSAEIREGLTASGRIKRTSTIQEEQEERAKGVHSTSRPRPKTDREIVKEMILRR